MMDKGKFAPKTEAHGQLVWDLLAKNPGGLTMGDLMELAELSRAQVRKAFEWIRDLFALEQDQPIVYLPGKHRNVYKLAITELETDEDLRRRVRTWRLQIQRARTAVAQPSMAKWPEQAPLFKKLARDFERTEEDLAYLLNGIG